MIPGLGRSWRREKIPTPVFLPGEFHGQSCLVGYSPWGRKEWGTTEHAHKQTTKWNSGPERLAHGVPHPVKGQRRFLEKGTLNLRDKESVSG